MSIKKSACADIACQWIPHRETPIFFVHYSTPTGQVFQQEAAFLCFGHWHACILHTTIITAPSWHRDQCNSIIKAWPTQPWQHSTMNNTPSMQHHKHNRIKNCQHNIINTFINNTPSTQHHKQHTIISNTPSTRHCQQHTTPPPAQKRNTTHTTTRTTHLLHNTAGETFAAPQNAIFGCRSNLAHLLHTPFCVAHATGSVCLPFHYQLIAFGAVQCIVEGKGLAGKRNQKNGNQCVVEQGGCENLQKYNRNPCFQWTYGQEHE